MVEKDALQEQIAYYRVRANEYDEWFLRQGRYDRGKGNNRRWFGEVDMLLHALRAFGPQGDILELACGTGLWTQYLVRDANHLTAVDSSPEMLDLNRRRVHPAPVRYLQADIFDWRPDRRYDVVFFAFWMSHVPPERFASFWQTVADALRPGGRVFLIDSLFDRTSTAIDHHLEDPHGTAVKRRLNDGREFSIVKVFHTAGELSRSLQALGWHCTLEETSHYFLYGCASR